MLASFDGLMPPKTLSFVSSAAASSSSPRPRDIPPRVCPSECAAPRTPKVWSRRGILTLGEKAIPRAIRWVLGHVMKNEITLAAAPLDDESPLVGLLRVLADAGIIEIELNHEKTAVAARARAAEAREPREVSAKLDAADLVGPTPRETSSKFPLRPTLHNHSIAPPECLG